MILHKNKSLHFLSESFEHNKLVGYSVPGMERNGGWGWGGNSREITPEERAESERRKTETDLRLKARKIHQALEVIAAIHELLPALGEKLSPMVITALGNMSEQAASTLSLIEKK